MFLKVLLNSFNYVKTTFQLTNDTNEANKIQSETLKETNFKLEKLVFQLNETNKNLLNQTIMQKKRFEGLQNSINQNLRKGKTFFNQLF